MSEDIRKQLKIAYDQHVAEREGRKPWRRQIEERETFLSRMAAVGGKKLLDAGGATGIDARYFADHGIDVTCIDLAARNVAAAREKGLHALEMDVTQLDFADGTFDAAWSWNCLLHLPKSEWSLALAEIRRVLKPGGLFFLGVYGGNTFEGVWTDDDYEPHRFYTFMQDGELQAVVAHHFEIIDFHTHLSSASAPAKHFQAITCIKRSTAE